MERFETTYHGLPVVAFYDDDADGISCDIFVRSIEWRGVVEMIDGMTKQEISDIESEIFSSKVKVALMAYDASIEMRIDRREAA